MVSWMKVSTGSEIREGRPEGSGRPHSRALSLRPLADELVRAVRLDLEDVELRVQRVIGLRQPLERPSEDPVLDADLLDVLQDGLARCRAVTLDARKVD